MVSQAITAVGKKISLDCGSNLTKERYSKKLAPHLRQTFNGWAKEDPQPLKKLPIIESNLPEHLAKQGVAPRADERTRPCHWGDGKYRMITPQNQTHM